MEAIPLNEATKTTPQGKGRQGANTGSLPQRVLVALNIHSRNGAEQGEFVMQALAKAGVSVIGDAPMSVDALPEFMRGHRDELRPQNDRLLLGGGDGTINRMLPHMVEAGIPLCILPMGTANDLARTLGLPVDPLQALEVALSGTQVKIDLGRVNDHLFVNVASIGLGPKVTERLSGEIKRRLGVLGYPRALLSAYRDTRPFRCHIILDDDAEYHLRVIHLAVGNGRFYGGGAVVSEDAAVDDNRLDLYSLLPIPLWRLIQIGPWVKKGQHRELEEVHSLHGRRIKVWTSRRLPVSADGEMLTHTPATFEIVPRVLSVIVRPAADAPGLIRSPTQG